LEGKKTGPNPTDRAKEGTKRSLLCDGSGIPLAVCVEGANRHDMKLVEETLESILAPRPEPTEEHPHNLLVLPPTFGLAEKRLD
jgi:putative transposase